MPISLSCSLGFQNFKKWANVLVRHTSAKIWSSARKVLISVCCLNTTFQVVIWADVQWQFLKLDGLMLMILTNMSTSATQPRCWCVWSAFSALLWHQPSRRITLQTFYCRQPSYSGCRRQDLERAAGQSGRNDVTTDFPAPFEHISVSAFFSIGLQWTWQ